MRTVAAESLLEWVTLGEWRCVLCEGGGAGQRGTRRERKAIQMRGSEERMKYERLNGGNAKCISLGITCHPSLSTLTD